MNEGERLLHRELNGELTPDEHRTLERLCRTDPALRRERQAWSRLLANPATPTPSAPSLPPCFAARLERAMAERPHRRPGRIHAGITALAMALLTAAVGLGWPQLTGSPQPHPEMARSSPPREPVRIVARGHPPSTSEPISVEF